jgi:hypothetical protein
MAQIAHATPRASRRVVFRCAATSLSGSTNQSTEADPGSAARSKDSVCAGHRTPVDRLKWSASCSVTPRCRNATGVPAELSARLWSSVCETRCRRVDAHRCYRCTNAPWSIRRQTGMGLLPRRNPQPVQARALRLQAAVRERRPRGCLLPDILRAARRTGAALSVPPRRKLRNAVMRESTAWEPEPRRPIRPAAARV